MRSLLMDQHPCLSSHIRRACGNSCAIVHGADLGEEWIFLRENAIRGEDAKGNGKGRHRELDRIRSMDWYEGGAGWGRSWRSASTAGGERTPAEAGLD